MRRYDVGDIVTIDDNKALFFIVLDSMDFSLAGSNDIDIDYELMQIYPVVIKPKYVTVNHSQLEIHSVFGSKDYEIFIDFVMKHRHKLNLKGTPDFITAMEERKNSNNENKSITPTKTKQMIITDKPDVVRYDKFTTVDMCLDAINDLNTLHKMFGDEAFIQLKELVINRLQKLV